MTAASGMRTVAASVPAEKTPMRPSVPGIILIVIGVLFLLRNFGLELHLSELFARWWPLLLIALGASMLFKNRRA